MKKWEKVFNFSLPFLNKIRFGKIPIVYLVIETDRGNRFYAEKEMGGIFEQTSFTGYGTFWGMGYITSKGISAIEKKDRLKNAGTLEKILIPRTRDYINASTKKERQNITIVLDDSDKKLAKALPLEPFLTKTCRLFWGFEEDEMNEHLLYFSGKINQVEINQNEMILSIQEL